VIHVRLRTLVCAALLLPLLAACDAASSATTPTSTHSRPTPLPTPGNGATRTPKPLPTAIPARFAHEAADPDPNVDYGLVVQYTPTGFHPQDLVVPCCMPVVFENLSEQPMAIRFVAFTVESGSIAPGDVYLFAPTNALSYAYELESQTSVTGVLSVTPTVEPTVYRAR